MKKLYILLLSCAVVLCACGKNVTVEIPSGLLGESGAEAIAEQFENTDGFKKVTVNSDGSMKVVVTQEKYNAQLERIKSVANDFYTSVKQDGYLGIIKTMDYDDEYTHLTFTLDREAYEASKDSENGENMELLITISCIYHVFSLDNDAEITVDYIDEKTGEIYKTDLYNASGAVEQPTESAS